MATHITAHPKRAVQLDRGNWLKLGLVAAAASVAAVLIVQALAIAVWPEIPRFQPLNSALRAAIFTLVPALGATAVFAWLVQRRPQPVRTFVTIAAVVLVVSIIPDYLLPVPDKTLLASTVTAALHVVAAIVTVGVLLIGYWRYTGRTT